MPSKPFEQLDLNLLRTFLVLYRVRNTRMAGEILNLSQPAVSRALQRLREHFDDQLMLRTPRGLAPTPRAEQLAKELPGLMASLAQMCSDEYQFDPASLNETVRMAFIAPVIDAIGDEFCYRLYQQAPNLTVELVNWSESTQSELISGQVKIGVNFTLSQLRKEITQRPLCPDKFVLLARPNHPGRRKTISMESLSEYPMASLMIPGFNEHHVYAARLCNKHGMHVKNSHRFTQVNVLANLAARTDAVVPGSRMLHACYPDLWAPLDIELEGLPVLDYTMCYHSRNRGAAYYQWLEQMLKDILYEKLASA